MGSITPSYPAVYPPFPNTGSLDGHKLVHLTPAIGSEFRDVDVTAWLREPNSDDILRDLSLLLAQRGVIFFRDQHNINDTLQKELCRRLNELSGAPKENGFYRHSLLAMQGEDPEMGKVDPDRLRTMYNKPLNGMPRQTHIREWHTDSSFEYMPPSYTVLRLGEMPETGGDTLWASGYELYDRLSPPYKRFYDTLTATHQSPALAEVGRKNPKGMDSGPRGASGNVGLEFCTQHPLVRTHPLTGWKAVFGWGTNCHHIDDVTEIESKGIFEKNRRLIMDNQDLQVRFRWESTGDLAVWDNRCTFHTATHDHFGLGERVGWRCMVMGERPFLDPKAKSRLEATGGWPYTLENPIEG
ncbi:alpha-ketoglutarate-dependent sulfonate dioxygenase [Aspergillus ellipticus CBS 707.79]|uniref:Alpha-ketoglutarate-dependent sulfonate dioxygenase n=1 Tax=Aspergillus ellipticus CBS 707.79 TaxID=1448320 RepID=A0A319D8X9_9EURO|nr:alpha-ketoglutarate-dependent sulfonate dioxygenase [Aspergillus ellipticus CBS 707.79]